MTRLTPGCTVRCRRPSGETAEGTVTAVRHFPVDFVEVLFAGEDRPVAYTSSSLARAVAAAGVVVDNRPLIADGAWHE
ncbi:MAG: hypothetical protein LBE07_08280 [Gordonia sp. (in: high G+C Gram-positive bacteria)]|jgi:hypothetical protein|nr:hypothetical protein [Gordonia sp. (in: high G+C Gram-positive bacteria)]